MNSSLPLRCCTALQPGRAGPTVQRLVRTGRDADSVRSTVSSTLTGAEVSNSSLTATCGGGRVSHRWVPLGFAIIVLHVLSTVVQH